jgi:hypothetical protein
MKTWSRLPRNGRRTSLFQADPTEMSDVEIPEAILDTPGPSKTKKDDEVQDIHSTSTKTTLQGGDGEELGGTEVEKTKVRLLHLERRRSPLRKGRSPHQSPHPGRKLRPPRLRLRLPSHKTTSTSRSLR